MKTIIVSLLALLCHSSVMAQQNLDEVVNTYILVKDALVKGDNKSAKTLSADLLIKVKGLKADGKLEKSTLKLSEQKDLEKQRKAFEEVSTTLWAIVKDAGKLEKDLYYQYCPMKKAYWISTEPAIKNPYYGSQMLTCGKVSDQKKN